MEKNKKKNVDNFKQQVQETAPVSELKFFENNPKRFKSKTFSRLLKSVKEIGIKEPLLVNIQTKTVLNGNQRLKVAMQLGLKEVPVIWTNYDKEDEAKILIHLNKTLAEQDEDVMFMLMQKYPDDVFIKDMMKDFDKFVKSVSQSMSSEYEISKDVDESYNYIVFISNKGVDYLHLETFFNLDRVYDQHKEKFIGQGRVIDAENLIKLLGFVSNYGIKNLKDL